LYTKWSNTPAAGEEEEKEKPFVYSFCDSSFASERGNKSRHGYLFFVLGGLVSWQSCCSKRVVTSSTEAECHGLVEAGKEARWIREFLAELSLFTHIPSVTIYQDNQSAIRLVTGGVCHKRSKHFGIEFDALKEMQQEGEIDVIYKNTNDLPADMFTKNLPPSSFVRHRDTIMGERGRQREWA